MLNDLKLSFRGLLDILNLDMIYYDELNNYLYFNDSIRTIYIFALVETDSSENDVQNRVSKLNQYSASEYWLDTL